MASAEPRAHHYVPQCWLAGFTETGEKDGQLWVTDFSRAKQWRTNPAGAGHIRDFYRLSDTQPDPIMVENAFSKIEDAIAPVLKSIDVERREPFESEREDLLYFIAIQWARAPAFRPLTLGVLDKLSRAQISQFLETRETWEEALKAAGMSINDPGADYDAMREAVNREAFSLSAENDWYIQQTFKAVDAVLPSLLRRDWRIAVSPSGSFIGSDNPVSLDAPKGSLVGFENAEVVTYALSRHVLLLGAYGPWNPPFVNRKRIARANTYAMHRAYAQVYSPKADFYWLDEHDVGQTDWTLFSKDKF